jgi:hypothetical protein
MGHCALASPLHRVLTEHVTPKRPAIAVYDPGRRNGGEHPGDLYGLVKRSYEAIKQASTRRAVAFRCGCMADLWEQLTSFACHRYVRRTSAVYDADENGKRGIRRRFRLRMKCIGNRRKQRIQEFNAATETLPLRTKDIVGKEQDTVRKADGHTEEKEAVTEQFRKR